MLMTGARKKALKCVSYIHYPVQFKDISEAQVQALIDSEIEVNAIHPIFAKQVDLSIRPIDVGVQKIDGTMLDTHGMVVAAFLVMDKANQVRFFEKIFLVANVSPEVVLEMPFLTLSNADVDFSGRKLRWRTYTTEKALPITRRIKLVDKKKFAVAVLNSEHETYVVHVKLVNSNVLPSSSPLDVYPSQKPWISGLIAKKAPTKVFAEYLDFADVFSLDLVSELPKYTKINNYAIELVKNCQQSPYGPIYNLGPVELETLKAYIEINLANDFIRLFKLSADAPILFDRKSDAFLWLCVNYQGLNNLIIKNRYPLPLIRGLLDRLRRVRRFTQLDFTSMYHQMRICKKNK